MMHQKVKQLELGRANLDGGIHHSDTMRSAVKLQTANGDAVSCLLRCSSSQNRPNTRKQFLCRKRFGDVVICSSV